MTATESELLTALHRRWLETRDPKDGDRFSFFINELKRHDAKNRFPAFERSKGET